MISAVILTKNEEINIKDCINSLLWCDEIIVIDDNSTDNTQSIVKKSKAQLFTRPLGNDFSAQRNFGLEKAKGDWILFLDADERVSLSLAYEIQTTIVRQLDHIEGYYVRRIDTLWGRQLLHGEIGSIRLLRLGRKNAGKWTGTVHEVWNIRHADSLKNPIQHFPHQTITEFLHEINRYTSLRAKELYENKTPVSAFDIVFYPKAKFFLNYFVKLGFLDGSAGLVVAVFMSFHSYLVRAKLWSLWHKK